MCCRFHRSGHVETLCCPLSWNNTMSTEIDFNAMSAEVTEESIRYRELQRSGADWRWQRAMRIVGAGRAYHSHALGSVVWNVVHHFRPILQSHQPKLMGDRTVDVAGAKRIRHERLTRLKLESRILSGLSVSEVAAKMELEESLVRDYCDIFFDVRTSLAATSWIMQQITTDEMEGPDYLRRTLYRHAFQGGPDVCEHWLDHLDQFGQQQDLSTAAGRAAERLELCVLLEPMRSDPESMRALGHLHDQSSKSRRLPQTVGKTIASSVHQKLRLALAGQVSSKEPASEKRSRSAA